MHDGDDHQPYSYRSRRGRGEKYFVGEAALISEINELMLTFVALAALSELMHAAFVSDECASGADMLCGLCCAGCLLGALEAVLGALM